MATLLGITVFLPLLGALLIFLMQGTANSASGRGGYGNTSGNTFRWIALGFTLATLLLASVLILQYQPVDGVFASIDRPWLPAESLVDVRLSLGLDGLSLWMFGLSALLMLTSVLVSWEAIDTRQAGFYGMLLLLECGCLGVFAARDLILFYIFFEFTLIPLFFLIGIWGSEDRRYAAVKFFIYTLAGSLLTFLGLLSIVIWDFGHQTVGDRVMTFSILELTQSLARNPMPPSMQVWVFVALFAGFAIKVPLFPFHTWLPLAHVQAPTAGSVFLAGILLKIGTYGFLRFSVPMLPLATSICMPWLLWLSVAGIIYGALVALAQTDMKRLIAYSSVSHLGFCMLGMFALNSVGTQGAALQMINHGISTGALFALVGMLYERYHTREIAELGGLAGRLPVLSFFLVLFTFSSIGLPGLNGFAGEILILMGMFRRGWVDAPDQFAGQFQWIAVLAVSGVVLGAWYMLWLVQRLLFGKLHQPAAHHDVSDLKWREIAALAPLAVFVFWIGIRPNDFLKPMQPTLNEITSRSHSAFADQFLQAQRKSSDTFREYLTRAD